MTVQELINELSYYNENTEVYFGDNTLPIHFVEERDALDPDESPIVVLNCF